MRVLLVTNDYPPKSGGIQQYVGNIADRLEHNVRVLAPADDPSDDSIDVVRHARTFMWPTPGVRSWIEEHVTDFAADVVVFGAPYPLAFLGPRLGKPYVVMTHGAEVVMPLATPGLRQLIGSTLKQADLVFAVSEFTSRRVSSKIGRPVLTLGAGVDVDTFHPAATLPTDRLVIGCVSRFVPRKGQRRVLAAAERLFASGVDCEVLLVGGGRQEGALRAEAASLHVPVRFEVDVPWERLPDLYRQMSVFVMPATSRWGGLEVEGLGIVYLEAASSGLPVIAGPSGGAPETVVVGETGFVASTVADIFGRLAWFAEDRQRLVTFGAAGRRWAETRWTWDAVIERFSDGLESVKNA